MDSILRLLCQPLIPLSLILGLAIANLWRKRTESRRRLLFVTIAFVVLMLSCTSAVSTLVVGPLEWPYADTPLPTERPEALVILSGDAEPDAPNSTVMQLGTDTYYRCVHALDVYHRTGEPLVLVSGGQASEWTDRPSLAETMRDFLVRQGIKESQIIVENKSQNTHENAVESCRLLRERGIHHILLVTDAMHMPRAWRCFAKEGMVVDQAPCNFITARFTNTPAEYLPSPAGALHLEQAAHEYIGLVYYWLRGWI
ncbi:MAG TPA: YdcF family protein [Gemmataceae bacterium]|nr:YdcF family protein [Gemmataceae bacterium]